MDGPIRGWYQPVLTPRVGIVQPGLLLAAHHSGPGSVQSPAPIERVWNQLSRHATLVTLRNGYLLTLSWFGGVLCHRVIAPGNDRFG